MTDRKTAIVTGSSRGIGRAIAIALGERGFAVAVNYASSRGAAEDTAQRVRDAGGEAIIVQADIGSADDRARLLDESLSRFGRVNLLVNNAGVAPKVRADLLETPAESIDYVLDTNLKAPFLLTQAVARAMVVGGQAWGRRAIVNIGSISAYTASVNRGEYCIAKAGIAMMTRLFAARLAEHGIHVYEVRPGIIETDMTAGVKEKYDKLILEQGLTPIRRWGTPHDVAQAVLAIADGRLPFSTGEVINVDGGFHLRTL